MGVRGRYAPSPTGLIHLGNARTALVAWLSARSRGGAFVWRLEDLDPPRALPGAADAALADLTWLGLDWDEGPRKGGPYAPYVQSARAEHYEAALQHLAQAGRLFPCRRTRKDLRQLASAPHGTGGLPPYPPALRPRHLNADWFETLAQMDRPDAAMRFQVHDQPVVFTDRVQGACREQVDQTVGDFVLKRRDGLYAYQLAVVVDDLLMHITEVVRGADLLASTARQIQLIEALGGPVPAYAHVPMVVNAAGEKLSKRNGGLTLRALREAGIDAAQIVGYLAYTLGLLETPTRCRPEALVPRFTWPALNRADWQLPEDLVPHLREIL